MTRSRIRWCRLLIRAVSIANDMIPGVNEVRDLCLAAGLTQDKLAERSGVAQPNIAAYETGHRSPSASMLNRLRVVAKPRPSTIRAMLE